MPDEIKDIQERLFILETARQSKARFFFQYLFAPLLVLGFGFFLISTLKRKNPK